MSEDDQTNDAERPNPALAGETADDDLVARRRDVRGARRRDQILGLLRTVESGSLSVEEIAERFGVSFATVRATSADYIRTGVSPAPTAVLR